MKSFFFVPFILLSVLLCPLVNCQSFEISHVPAEYYSIDRFANEIYYQEFASSNIYIRNLSDWSVRVCPFPSLPAFANTSHKCVYGDGDSIFVFDFKENSKLKIYDSAEYYLYDFSPNDKYLLIPLHYFSFNDSSLHFMEFSPEFNDQNDWVNETTLTYFFDDYMYTYDFITDSYDTLFHAPQGIPISSCAYDAKRQLLYYSIDEYEYPKIHTYNIYTGEDSIAYDPAISDTNNICWDGTNAYRFMGCSPDYSKLAFFSYILEAGGTIYTFIPDSGRLERYTKCGGEGNEAYLKWINKDTIVYFNASIGYIQGFALDNPLLINEDNPELAPNTIQITAFPNPFNGLIQFNLNGDIEEPELSIYNINGEEIDRIENLNGTGSKFTAVWNGKNSYGAEVSSGVYFAIVRNKQNPFLIKGTSKIIYLK